MEVEEDFISKTPFYMTYPLQNLYKAELEYEKDFDRVREFYPKEVMDIQRMIEERLDELEGPDSRIYDEEPDWDVFRMYLKDIYDKVDNSMEMTSVSGFSTKNAAGSGGKSYFDSMPDFLLSASSLNENKCCTNCKNPKCQIVDILFANELYKRRCRYNRSKRWW